MSAGEQPALRLRGGGGGGAQKRIGPVPFTDVSNAGVMQKIPWSKFAPAWRIATPGLSIEGVCTNVGCTAYNQWVISNHGMGTFDLLEDEGECTCPMCHETITPVTCALNNCQWFCSGFKLDCAGAPETVKSKALNAGDWCVNYL